MPSEIMDQRNMTTFYKPTMPSSFFSEEVRFPSERQVGFWKTASMPDHRGLDSMPFMSEGKAVSSSPLEKIEHNFDQMELPHNICKEPKWNVTVEQHWMGAVSAANSWRTLNHDAASMSKLYSQSSSLSVECGKVAINGGYYENGLFSSSMSDIFNKNRGLISNDVLVGQSGNTDQSNYVKGEAFESLEEIEAQTIGDLLPDDDDLLSGAIHNQGHVAQSNWTDVEDDLFCSVGGMELELDGNTNYSSKKASEIDYGRIFNGLGRGLNKPQPSRMLLVKNVDSNIKDMELRVLFEQYGDIHAFYTLYRHCGVIMVSYHDIRAAQNAFKMLQTKTINGQELDIQFCISKENHSENGISEGMLLVTNLETSISNDDLLHIFGAYGEIKEICETPQNRHCKIIEFYDVRAAEAALLALNRCDIAGKRIQVEPWCFRLCSMQKLALNREEEEAGTRRQEIYSKNWPSDCFGTSTSHHSGAIQGSIDSELLKITSSIPCNMTSQARVSVIGNSDNHSVNSELSHSLGKTNIGLQNRLSFPDFHDGVHNATQFSSPNTVSAMALNMNSTLVTNGIDNSIMHRVGSVGHSSHSFEHNKSAFSLGIGSCPPHSHEYIWNNSNTYHHHHPGSITWQNMPPFMGNNNIPAQNLHVHGLSRGPSHMPSPILTPNQHVGSAPPIAFHTNSLGSMGYSSCSPLHSLEFSSHNIFPHAGGPAIEPSISSTHVGTPSSQPRAHIYRAKNNVTASSRSRRSHSSANQSDSSRQYELDVERIAKGEDLRTTLMIKNIPNKYTSKMLLATIDEQHKGTYDFIYLPIDFKNKCNVGYAFINMTDPQHIIPFYQVFNGKKWEKFNSEKVAYLAYARIQGKAALIGHFQNSSLMNEDKRCRPIIFHTDGPNAGDQEPFPVPVGVNIRYRRSQTNTENHQGSSSGSSSEDESSNSAKDSE